MSDHDDTPRLSPQELPVVHNQADLERLWRLLMEPLGFAAPQIWILFLREGHCQHSAKLEELPRRPDAADLARLTPLLTSLAEEPDVVPVFLYARPGAGREDGDLAWARTLAPHTPWPVHVAHDSELRVVAADELAASV